MSGREEPQAAGWRRKRWAVRFAIPAAVVVAAAVAIVVLTTGSATLPVPAQGTPIMRHSAANADVLTAPAWRFGLRLLSDEAGRTDGNVVVSPVALHAALSLVLNGAEGQTARELRGALGLGETPLRSVDQAWADLIASAHTSDGSRMRIGASVWARVAIKPAFAEVADDYFAATTDVLDPAEDKAARQLNDWISEQTEGRVAGQVIVRGPHIASPSAATFHSD